MPAGIRRRDAGEEVQMRTALKAALAAVAIAGFGSVTTASAMVQGPACGPRGSVVEQLARSFAEQPVGYGLTPDGALVEVLAGPKGTWTILVTLPSGHACLMAHGFDWEPQPSPQSGPVT
jgi:hypothetical protein